MKACLRTALALALILAFTAACVKQSQTPTAPGSSTKAEQLGDAQFQAGNFEKAIEFYNTALEEGADPASVCYRKGFAHFAQDQWDEALTNFQAAIRADPKLAIAYEGAGMSSFQLAQLDEAGRYFKQTMDLAPTHWVSYAFLAAIAQVKGNPQEAKLLGDRAMELGGEEQRPTVLATMRDAYDRAVNMTPTVRKAKKEESSEPEAAKPEEAKPEEAAPAPKAEEQKAEAAPASKAEPAPEPAAKAEEAQQPKPEAAAPTKQAQAEEPKPEVKPAPKAEPKPEPKPEPKAEAQAAPKGNFAILESSWQNKGQAESRMAALRTKGLSVYTAQVNLGSRGIWHRVLFGPYKDIAAARAAKDSIIKEHGLKELLILKVR